MNAAHNDPLKTFILTDFKTDRSQSFLYQLCWVEDKINELAGRIFARFQSHNHVHARLQPTAPPVANAVATPVVLVAHTTHIAVRPVATAHHQQQSPNGLREILSGIEKIAHGIQHIAENIVGVGTEGDAPKGLMEALGGVRHIEEGAKDIEEGVRALAEGETKPELTLYVL